MLREICHWRLRLTRYCTSIVRTVFDLWLQHRPLHPGMGSLRTALDVKDKKSWPWPWKGLALAPGAVALASNLLSLNPSPSPPMSSNVLASSPYLSAKSPKTLGIGHWNLCLPISNHYHPVCRNVLPLYAMVSLINLIMLITKASPEQTDVNAIHTVTTVVCFAVAVQITVYLPLQT